MNNLLIDRTILVDHDNPDQRHVNWYSALRLLNNYKSVVKAEWTNTCSSAGDWDGYLVQHINNTNYLIPISQENNYPRLGFTLYTGRLMASWTGEFNHKDAEAIYNDCMVEA